MRKECLENVTLTGYSEKPSEALMDGRIGTKRDGKGAKVTTKKGRKLWRPIMV